jgi:glycosyltransferase involved in cell wall biosynthesis
VVPWYEPAWASGGTAVAVSNACRGLARLGEDVSVYTTDDAGGGARLSVPLGRPVETGGVTVWYFRADFPVASRAAFGSSSLAARLAESAGQFDLVHASATRNLIGRSVRRACRRHGRPYIVWPHASLMHWWVRGVGAGLAKLPLVHWLEGPVVAQAAAIHFLCEGERAASARYRRGRCSFIVPNGLDTSMFAPDPAGRDRLRRRIGAAQGQAVLLQLGRIAPQKNLDVTLEALSMLRGQGMGVRLAVVGPASDAGYAARCRKLADRLGLGDAVHWEGPVQAAGARAWYQGADLLAMPSRVEGVSMALVEAMASGLPAVVSSRVANGADVASGGAGVVCEPTADDLAGRLRGLLGSPGRLAACGRNARRLAVGRYDSAVVAGLMQRAYRDVLEGARSAALAWD